MLSRATLFRWHSWLGITTGVFMLVIAWSGSLAVFNDEIGWLATRELRADPALGARPLEDVVQALRARFPDREFDLHVQAGPNWAHTAYVYEPGHTVFVHIDPATARVSRADVMEGYTWNIVYFIRQLHVRLLMGLWGRVFVGIFGVTLVLSIITSLWIYRDWLRSLVRVRTTHARRIFHMDLHKAVGAWALVVNLIFGISGAVLGLENLYYQVFPRRNASVAASATTHLEPLPAGLSHGMTAAALATRFPEFVPTVINVDPQTPIVTVRGDHPGALIAKDASVFRVDPTSGRILETSDARRASWGTYLYNTLDPLHFGYFGDKWGTWWSYGVKTIWCVLGLTPGVLSITGGYMWWLRRERARAAASGRLATPQTAAVTPGAGFGRWYGIAIGIFLVAGYLLQVIVFNRGWEMTEVLWQHWMVKPLCLIIVAFPVTLIAVAIGQRMLSVAERGGTPARAVWSATPLGVLYLVATSVLN